MLNENQKRMVRSFANMAATCRKTVRQLEAANLPCEYAEGFLKGFIQSAKFAAWSFRVQNIANQ